MTREEAIERFNGIINAMSISVAQAKFYPTKAELDELCDMAIEALSVDAEQEAVPTVVRVTMSDGSQYYLEHERDAIQADADVYEDYEHATLVDIKEPLKVLVVRCKDCRHLFNKDFCSFFGSPTDAMDYCSYGERISNRGEEINGFKSVGQAWNTSQER